MQVQSLEWRAADVNAYELNAYHACSNRLDYLATRALANGLQSIANTRWSAILVPWLWLASHEAASHRFAEALAEYGRGVHDEAT